MTQERFDILIAARRQGKSIAECCKAAELDFNLFLKWRSGRMDEGSRLSEFWKAFNAAWAEHLEEPRAA